MSFLQVDQLTKKFGSRIPVKGISFQLERGSCTALLGPNGAGKTTTMRMIAGLISPSEGRIAVQGRLHSSGEYRSLIGYLPQHPAFYGWMTGEEFVMYAAGLSGLSRQDARKRTLAVLERVGLHQAAKRRIAGYSGGMKQRLGLAQALVHQPQLLLLDEPVSALDPIGRREVMNLLQSLRTETTILFSTHVLPDAEEVCDRIMMMRDGEIVENGELQVLADKYRKPQLIIQVERNNAANEWLQSLRSRPFVQNAQIQGSTAQLTVNNMEDARRLILGEVVSRNIPLLNFETGATSLEEMFMKVVTA
ncbi:ATP-binding cassette domain-containing protein [Paenibacillus woosongensis]|uniref:ATP-binding cassette domain-containing protein n=1 Tax=Paenibacillus woosongensis TaxID=307580 RepID=A0A7X3CP80_9BACL|nr:ABC transporter ATP-binding protein [Paenibacillus woosongensis]MUG46589.1 ATP-binding cassette domain-containing protein [Paenibacillus woosongensis]